MTSPSTQLVMSLFESVPNVMVCVKDAELCYVAVNDAFVRRLVGARAAHDVIGRRASDLFPAELAVSYEAQDRSILHTGVPVQNQLEVITTAKDGRAWFLTSKALVPVDGGTPEIVAVTVEAPITRGSSGDDLRAAIDLARTGYADHLKVEDLATAAGMTSDQLERAMKRVVGMSPKQYMVRVRLDAAAHMIATTDLTIAQVAARCGFFDQSQLSRQMKAIIGLNPGDYRAMARAAEPPALGTRPVPHYA
jgi:AraC-like DNA-binding protein